MDEENLVESQPVTLVDLLNNTLIWRQTAPYLPAGSVLALSATSRVFRHVICDSPETFRHLNLSSVKSATLADSRPIDSGGKLMPISLSIIISLVNCRGSFTSRNRDITFPLHSYSLSLNDVSCDEIPQNPRNFLR
jgi:hypothetical protein